MRAIDPALAVLKIDTVDEQLDDILAQDRLMAVLAALFGGMRVLLSCLGLYGLVAQVMSRRTSEIAVRVALGATRIDILRIVLREGLQTMLIGVAAGIPIALGGAATLIAPLLLGVRPGRSTHPARSRADDDHGRHRGCVGPGATGGFDRSPDRAARGVGGIEAALEP